MFLSSRGWLPQQQLQQGVIAERPVRPQNQAPAPGWGHQRPSWSERWHRAALLAAGTLSTLDAATLCKNHCSGFVSACANSIPEFLFCH